MSRSGNRTEVANFIEALEADHAALRKHRECATLAAVVAGRIETLQSILREDMATDPVAETYARLCAAEAEVERLVCARGVAPTREAYGELTTDIGFASQQAAMRRDEYQRAKFAESGPRDYARGLMASHAGPRDDAEAKIIDGLMGWCVGSRIGGNWIYLKDKEILRECSPEQAAWEVYFEKVAIETYAEKTKHATHAKPIAVLRDLFELRARGPRSAALARFEAEHAKKESAA